MSARGSLTGIQYHHQQPNLGRVYSLVASIDLLSLIRLTGDTRTEPFITRRSGRLTTTHYIHKYIRSILGSNSFTDFLRGWRLLALDLIYLQLIQSLILLQFTDIMQLPNRLLVNLLRSGQRWKNKIFPDSIFF